MRYEILGRVTARAGDREIPLTPQRQLLLAILIMAAGRPVDTHALIDRIWESREIDDPIGALRTNIAYLRTNLREASDDDNPIPLEAGGYRLLLDPHDSDVLRFRIKLSEARRMNGPDAVAATNEALDEWGPGATGLFGGNPLSGLDVQWANNVRRQLQIEYRDARFFCLQNAWERGEFDVVAADCAALAGEAEAFQDEKFVKLWMHAAYQSAGRRNALLVYESAAEAMTRLMGVPVSRDLTSLAQRIRDEDKAIQLPRTTDLIPCGSRQQLAVPQRQQTKEAESVSEQKPSTSTTFTFNNQPGSNIGVQGDIENANVTMEKTSQPVEPQAEPSESGEPES